MSGSIFAMEAVASAISASQAIGTAGSTTAAPGFAALMQPLSQASSDVATAEASLAKLAEGQPLELHEVMIDLENARISVLTLIQIRNKALEAYQEMMRMQV